MKRFAYPALAVAALVLCVTVPGDSTAAQSYPGVAAPSVPGSAPWPVFTDTGTDRFQIIQVHQSTNFGIPVEPPTVIKLDRLLGQTWSLEKTEKGEWTWKPIRDQR